MIPERVVARYLGSLQPEGECLVSSYSTGSHGYTQLGWSENGKTKMVLGHRVAWIAAHGPVPEGMTVDHLCRNRRCGRIEHLRLLTNLDNARDNGFARRTHCPRGHEYTPENTRTNKRGHRWCRACQVIHNRRRTA